MGECFESHNVCESVTEGLFAHFTVLLVYQEQLPRSFDSRFGLFSERRRKGAWKSGPRTLPTWRNSARTELEGHLGIVRLRLRFNNI